MRWRIDGCLSIDSRGSGTISPPQRKGKHERCRGKYFFFFGRVNRNDRRWFMSSVCGFAFEILFFILFFFFTRITDFSKNKKSSKMKNFLNPVLFYPLFYIIFQPFLLNKIAILRGLSTLQI